MDGARPAPFPHLSWLGYGFEAPAGAGVRAWILNGNAHALHMVFSGAHRVRWICRGRETAYTVQAGSFHYLPADDAQHTIIAYPSGAIRSFTLFVPRRHLTEVAASDGLDDRVEFHRLLVHDDPVLQACMARLAARSSDDDADAERRKEEAARRLVVRLIQASGGGAPDWLADGSVFTRSVLRSVIEHIDAHLRSAPTVADMAVHTGLSPSHFAKKFRQSTGLSLHRFINRRRVLRSLDLLKTSSDPLADVARDLGFSSQSHFTRLFSAVTCMTPARYRRQFVRSA